MGYKNVDEGLNIGTRGHHADIIDVGVKGKILGSDEHRREVIRLYSTFNQKITLYSEIIEYRKDVIRLHSTFNQKITLYSEIIED